MGSLITLRRLSSSSSYERFYGLISEVLRAVTFLIDSGKVMYWGTARWSPFELFEAYAKAKEHRMVGPIAEVGEYHWFHREKVELYMAELYNKIGQCSSTYIY